jgi:hypothetical protein
MYHCVSFCISTVGAEPIGINVGQTETIPLNAALTGLSSIARFDINWGDGSCSSYAGNAISASHVYTAVGTAEIQLTAVAPDGTAYNFPAVPLDISAAGVTAVPVNLAASASTDVFAISSDGSGDTIITKNGTVVTDEPTQNILALNLSGGATSVSINFTNGDPLPVGGFYSDAAIVELDGPHGNDPLVTTATAALIGNDVIRYSPTTALTDNLTSDGGILAIAGTTNLNDESGDSLIVAPGATALVNGSQTFSSLTIDAGATVRQISQNTTFGASVITAGSLSLQGPDTSGNGGGVLDLGNGDLIIHPQVTPEITEGETATQQVGQWLAAGYDGGSWDGEVALGPTPAAIVSSGAANEPTQLLGLGYAEIGTGPGQLALSEFDGNSVSDGDTVVALTYTGDANLDRTVNSTDEEMVGEQDTYTGTSVGGWTEGDFNYDGVVDASDTDLIATTIFCLENAPTTQPNPPATQPGAPTTPTVAVGPDKNGVAKIDVSSGGRYSMNRVLTVSDNTGGTIVQHIVISVDGKVKQDYWEAIPVPAGSNTVNDYWHQNVDHAGFSGTIVQTGEATYYPGGTTPPGFVAGNVPAAGNFPSSKTNPNLPQGTPLTQTLTWSVTNGVPTATAK